MGESFVFCLLRLNPWLNSRFAQESRIKNNGLSTHFWTVLYKGKTFLLPKKNYQCKFFGLLLKETWICFNHNIATTPDKTCWDKSRKCLFFPVTPPQLKPPPNECPISPLPLSKATLNRGWGGGLLFVFRGDRSRAQKLENRWNCLNSFVRGCSMY